MIKKFTQYNESIKNLLVGPTEDEIFKSIVDLPPYELLVKSCEMGLIKGIKYALKKGIIYDDKFKQLVDTYIRLNEIEIVELLINSTDIYFTINTINNGIKKCCNYECYLDMIKTLLEYIPDIHYQNDIFLLTAIDHNNHNIVKLLIDNGSDINGNFHGESFIKIALNFHYHEIVKLLLMSGCDLEPDTIIKLKLYFIQIGVTKEEIDNIQWTIKKQTKEELVKLINKYTKNGEIDN